MAKASDNIYPKLIIAEGAAPASPAAGQQKLFIDSADHKLKRVDSTGTVSTVEGGAGGGAGAWASAASLPLSTLTGWSAGTGTWALSGGVIRQTDTQNAARRLRLNTAIPLAEVVAEVDVKLDVTPNNVSSRGGFVFGTPSATDGGDGLLVSLITKGSTAQATAVDFERDATANMGQIDLAAPIANGTWITFRVHKVGSHFSAYVNGALVGTGQVQTSGGYPLGRLALYAYAADVSFRNLDVWTPTLP